MPVAYFQIQLSLQPKSGGEAVPVPPQVLQGVNYGFVIVKDGGEEGIVKLDGPDAALKQVEKDKNCKKLTTKQVETLLANYPKPKNKNKYRAQPRLPLDVTTVTAAGSSAVGQTGNKFVDTFQTVRSGFYLIDVPILTESPENPGI